jgi:hypothetical protein
VTGALLLLLFGRQRRLPSGTEGVTVIDTAFRVVAVDAEHVVETVESRYFVEAL